ncbi:hypothetical protein IDH44_11705 [Paenibacillus sp. IB182496]|uniref:Uncharacterized protein n=2 Tax=Paenibacillus sabuli TaxID=2772509 RepID=A0A927BUY7_9BACL|nr:DUF5693 family protein [Paenibacillus sabuli]MBD2845858.1 hypothetical protein [Paenibacillus sabuli]
MQNLNRKARKWLWGLVVLGLIAAVPLTVLRVQMEDSSNQVEFVVNYRDVLRIGSYYGEPEDFVAGQLEHMREAGVTTMAVFESNLDELSWAGRVALYSSAQMALLQGEPAPVNANYAYVLFPDARTAEALTPMIETTFAKAEVQVEPWAYEGRPGLLLRTSLEDAVVKTMPPDPLALEEIRAAGFQILPRLSDRIRPFEEERVDALLAQFKALGVERILFDGATATGFADEAELGSLRIFGELLNKHGIGLVAIENLSNQQSGFNQLAYATDYDVVRLHSLSDAEAMRLSPETIADRFVLAAKDRNIRMFYMNSQPFRSLEEGGIVHSLDNLYDALRGDEDNAGAIARLADFGFSTGQAKSFDYQHPSWSTPLKGVAALGAIALIALLIGAFLPLLLTPAFVLGLIGSAGLYVLSSALLEQGLALGASIAAPTLALIWVLNRIRLHTEGDRRYVGGSWDESDRRAARSDKLFGGQWVFHGLPAARRLTMAIGLYVAAAVLSLVAVPLIIALLNNVTYSLVLQQFRGVSLLHLAPIALVALYVFLYTGASPLDNLRKLLRLQITVLWVVVAGVLGVAGMYYLSRTGNSGQASSVEMLIRTTLETTIGVRPRFKEFMFAHPLLLAGIFLALRYRAAWVLLIVAAMGQLSMVDTFAHIHTPVYISAIRVALGLGIGLIFGLVLIGVWQLAEGVWRKWGKTLASRLQRL